MLLLAQSAVCDRSFRDAPDSGSAEKDVDVKKVGAHVSPVKQTAEKQQNPAVSAGIPDANKTADDVTSKSATDTNKTVHTTEPQKERSSEGHATSLNAGALKRGFYVFVGLSVLVMAYIVFRSFKLSKTRAQMVRKYGVLAHRQDVEMRPLPLEEEDDEDTTVFDASNVLTNNAQHQEL